MEQLDIVEIHDEKMNLCCSERKIELQQIRADIKNVKMEILSEKQYELEIEQFFKNLEN